MRGVMRHLTSAAKAGFFLNLAARLKSCPDTCSG